MGANSNSIFNLFYKQKCAMAYVGAYFVPLVESSVPKGQTFAWPASLTLRVRAGQEPVRIVRCLGPQED